MSSCPENQVYNLESFPGFDCIMSADETRLFLQNAIDYVGEKHGTLLFPHEKTFVISIPEGIPERSDYVHTGGDGLVIPSNIKIDLNGSTLKCATNNFYCYKIIHIPSGVKNVSVCNGHICGDRDTHILPHDLHEYKKSAEWNHALCIDACYNVCIDNLTLSDVRGDGIQECGVVVWNHVHPVKFESFEQGKVDNNGVVSESSDHLVSPMLSIGQFYSLPNLSPSNTCLMIRSTVDRHKENYEYSYHIQVAYYDEHSLCVGQETVNVGSAITIPPMAIYLRFSFWIPDPSQMKDNWWITAFAELKNSVVKNCEIFRCGRNGMVPGICRDVLIDSCYIHDIGGTNNEVGIDIEGTSFIQGGVTITNCTIERCKSSLTMPQASRVVVRNCSLDDIFGGSEDIIIENCTVRKNIKLYSQESDHYTCQEIFSSPVIRNCDVGGTVYAFNGLIENCVVKGGAVYNASRMFHRDDCEFPQMCVHCSFSSPPGERMQVSYAKYYECSFATTATDGGTGQICLLQSSKNLFSIIFEKCKFWGSICRSSMGDIALADIIDCELHGRNCDLSIASNKLIGNKFYTSSEVNTAAFRVQPYGDCAIICDNLFSVEDKNQEKHFYSSGLILDDSYFAVLPVAASVLVKGNVFNTKGNLSLGIINGKNATNIENMTVEENILDPSSGNVYVGKIVEFVK